jgi:hypothetical protein
VKLVGIDYSTHDIDLVLLAVDRGEGELPWWVHYDLPSVGGSFERTLEVANVMPARRSVFWDGVRAVAIEEPFGRGGSAVPLVRVQGAILSLLPPLVEVRQYAPGAWRRWNELPTRSSKQEVREHVMAELGTDPPWSQDACDAYCIARALELNLQRVEQFAEEVRA